MLKNNYNCCMECIIQVQGLTFMIIYIKYSQFAVCQQETIWVYQVALSLLLGLSSPATCPINNDKHYSLNVPSYKTSSQDANTRLTNETSAITKLAIKF